ncbi:MAG: glucose-1-phosphate adenylyltransferase, partial [Anaerolineaceae bacterium]|nr:glucose-1-phosphate adenylyltransferase [Anaerolineaceae bacterium]
MAMQSDFLAVILGGGQGSRLFPLTQQRAKPAVPIAGKYRLIDIPISNCINSGFYRIAVLTQFNSVSLHRHINRTYYFDAFHTGWVQVWAAEQTTMSKDWYQGTADAVRKQIGEIISTRARHIIILAGDHLYRMDYSKMARFHQETDADVTVAVQPVLASEAFRFGILKRDKSLRISNFAEKPTDADVLLDMVSRDDPERPYLGSMGIYVFKTEALVNLLANADFQDFGKHIIPEAIQTHKVYGYDFTGYWEDIGTIRSFYETNLMLTKPNAAFNFYDPDQLIYTRARFLPGSKIKNSKLEDVVIADGCLISDADIKHSLIGLRSVIKSGTTIIDSILMGDDDYTLQDVDDPSQILEFGIGSDCHIEGAIIDKNPIFGHGVTIKPFPRGTEIDGGNY